MKLQLPLNEKTIANFLSESGYSTAYIGKWHLTSTILLSKENVGPKIDYTMTAIPLERRCGYKDYWLASDLLEFTSHPYEGYLFNQKMEKIDFKGYRVDCLTDFALDFLDKYDQLKPFFLFLSYLEPHQQNDTKEIVGPKGSKENFSDYEIPGDLIDTKVDWKELFADYLGCCNRIDSNLQKITDKLSELGISENTIWIFTSDHGCHFRTRTWEYKRSCHESSIRIPLIIKGPGFKGGKIVNKLVSLIDIAPTILQIAGIKIPNEMRGKNLQNLVNNEDTFTDDEVFIQISESQVGRAIGTKRWKLAVEAPKKSGFLYAKSNKYVGQYLYDLESDPHERNNLISHPSYNEIRSELAQKLKKKIVEAGENAANLTL